MNNEDVAWDPVEFEKTWVALVEKMIELLMADATIQSIKEKVREKGHVEHDDRDLFIIKVNEIKNKVIEDEYGDVAGEQYKQFAAAWQHWQKLRGKNRPAAENVFEENINHLLYGSTPDPDLFLRDFNIYTDIK